MPQHDYHIATQAKFTALNELIEQQAAQIRELTDRNKQLQSKLLDARLAGDRTRIEPQVESWNNEALDEELEQAKQQIEALRGFAQALMVNWFEGLSVDGCDLQDMAETHGLLKPEPRTEPCGQNCTCAEYGDFPAECYRQTELLTGAK